MFKVIGLFLSICSTAMVSVTKSRIVAVLQVKITPLAYKKTSYITIDAFATASNPQTYKIYLTNEKYKSGVLICSHTFKSSEHFLYAYDNAYTAESNSIKIVNEKSGSPFGAFIHEAFLTVGRSKTIGADKMLESDSYVLTYDAKKGWLVSKEKLYFDGYDDIYFPDFYHKLDITSFKITQESSFNDNLYLQKGTLLITNREGVFNDLASSNSSYAELKVKLEKNDDVYTLVFDEDLYVNKKTLKMSSTKKDGYVKTRHLFFPINEMRYQGEYQCTLSLNDIGINHDKITHRFTFNSLLNLIGDCHNSEYCVVESA